MYKQGAAQEVSMRGFVVFAAIAVFLAGLFLVSPVCGDSGGLGGLPFHQSLVTGHWVRSGHTGSFGIMDGVSGYLMHIQERNWPWRMTDYGHGPGMMGYWFGGFLMWIIVVVIIAVLVYLIIRAKEPRGEDALMNETPLQILKKRYARGEISKEEFDEIRKNIEK